jgi:AAA15 family ATPase/GTPase
MLLSFSVENFLSFKNRVIFDLQAVSIKEHRDNVFTSLYGGGYSTLKSVGVFGPNASGKTNLVKAISFMKDFVLNSISSIDVAYNPFRLSTETEKIPSTFEITFLVDKLRYRYGFSVNSKNVESEWLFLTEKRTEENLFVRAKQNYSFEKKFKSALRGKYELIHEMTRPNTLFLSVLAQYNFSPGINIANWFSKIFIAHDTEHYDLIAFTARIMSLGDYQKLISDVITKSDLGIDSIETKVKEAGLRTNYSKEFLTEFFRQDSQPYSIRTGHYRYNKENKVHDKVFFDLLVNESLGTQKFFGILGPLLFSIKERGIVIIDEIDARMHSLLLHNVIALFNSNKTNANGAQLVFTSHNTYMLKKGLRRDQMVFLEKDTYGISSMKSLHVKYPKVRNDATFEKDYLSGKYGSIPGLGSQLDLFDGL